jgi:protein tyrosine/serine phosphatase
MDNETRWVRLQGAVNVRDLGGLPTRHGGLTKPGRVFRADNLQGLTPADVHHLVHDLGLRTVIDLRTTVEVEKEGPGPLTREPLVSHRHCSLFPEGGRMTDIDADALLPWQADNRPVPVAIDGQAGPDGLATTLSIGYYLGYLRDRPDSVVTALRAMAADGGASVVHCAAGKDRTGVVVALALAAAGVTREAIIADYVATGDVLDLVLGRLRNSPTYAADLDDRPPDTHRPRPHTLERFLQTLEERSGGPLGWLAKAGFGAADVDRLHARLLD